MRQRGDRHGIAQCGPLQRREIHGGRPARRARADRRAANVAGRSAAVALPGTTWPQRGRHSERTVIRRESGSNGGAGQILRCAEYASRQNDVSRSSDEIAKAFVTKLSAITRRRCVAARQGYRAATRRLARSSLTIVVDAMGGAFCEIVPRVLAAIRLPGHPPAAPPSIPIFPGAIPIRPQTPTWRNSAAVRRGRPGRFRRRAGWRRRSGRAGRFPWSNRPPRTIRRPVDPAVFLASAGRFRLEVRRCCSPRAAQAAGGTSLMQPSGHGFIKTAMIRR